VNVSFRIPMVVALLALGAGFPAISVAQSDGPPNILAVGKLKIQIVGATFMAKMTGANASYEETQPDNFRGLVVTLQVKKPAGEELTFYAQDFVLHYRFGKQTDVARCQGLSTFSTQQDADRTMMLYRTGIGSLSTGLATTKADVVYVDLFFQYMEPGTSDIHLFIAQPVGASFKTDGWK
jgi:hypothetical protein